MSDLAYTAAERNPALEAFLAAEGVAPGALVLDVDRQDEMLQFAVQAAGGDFDAVAGYFVAGRDVAVTIRQLVAGRFGGFDRLGSMLDFASGYGRVTRWLVRELAPERLWVSDIYPGAVEFQRRSFGVHAFPSASRPEELIAPRRFDFVFVASLFTHLPRPAFEAWLARLLDLLAPGGLLAFSVHDAALRDPTVAMPEDGFLYQAVSESRSLDTAQYGSSWVSEAYVRDAVERAVPGSTCTRLVRGLCRFQDLYLVAPGGGTDGIAFDGGPDGFLDACHTESGRLTLGGWAYDFSPGRRVVAVEASLDGGPAARVETFHPHAGVGEHFPQLGPAPDAAWRLELETAPGRRFAESILMVRARSDRGVETVFHLGTVEAALRSGAQWRARLADWGRQAAEAGRLRAELEARRQELRAAELAARVAAMEASFFWRLRNRWFALKRALRLTDEA